MVIGPIGGPIHRVVGPDAAVIAAQALPKTAVRHRQASFGWLLKYAGSDRETLQKQPTYGILLQQIAREWQVSG
jgi:hypothetical protein